MNRYQQILAVILFFSLSTFSVAQITVSGTVTDASTGEALAGANVVVNGTEKGSAADVNGAFRINNVPNGATLTASMIGYSDASMSAASTVNFKLSASALEMSALDVVANKATYRKTPVAFTDLNEEELQLRVASQDLTMVMNETPGVYATNGGGGAGDSYLYVRGFDQRNTAILINGVPVNDMENGWVYWSNWDGMSDVTSSIQIQRGLGASNLAIGSVGGTINVRTSAAEQESGGSFKQETGSYNFQKSTLTYHTGLSNSGFALSALLQRKTGSGYAYGTWTDAYAYFLTASKTFKNSLLDVYVLGAPQQHGQRDGDNNHPFETWNDVHGGDLRTNSGYNGSYDGSGSGWGYVSEANAQKIKTGQSSLDAVGSALFGNVLHTRKEIGGDKWMINNRTNYYHKPVYGLNFKYDVNNKTTISNVLYYSTGRGGGTGPLNSRGTGLYADDSLDADGNTVNFYSEASVKYINPNPDSEVDCEVNLVHDPWRPVPAIGGHLSDIPGEANRYNLDLRPDVAVFTSPPLSKELRIEGIPTIDLETQCDREGFDLFIALSIIPGKIENVATQLSTGILRVTNNEIDRKSYREIRLQPTLATLNSGDRLRISISGSGWPAIGINPGQSQYLCEGPSPHCLVTTISLLLLNSKLKFESLISY